MSCLRCWFSLISSHLRSIVLVIEKEFPEKKRTKKAKLMEETMMRKGGKESFGPQVEAKEEV
jgi:hypothetical protein